jgi:hypothetical protein
MVHYTGGTGCDDRAFMLRTRASISQDKVEKAVADMRKQAAAVAKQLATAGTSRAT